jgi:hypothetical protein
VMPGTSLKVRDFLSVEVACSRHGIAHKAVRENDEFRSNKTPNSGLVPEEQTRLY